VYGENWYFGVVWQLAVAHPQRDGVGGQKGTDMS
jgi:hypothetical protein